VKFYVVVLYKNVATKIGFGYTGIKIKHTFYKDLHTFILSRRFDDLNIIWRDFDAICMKGN
jgi:hypothetical protein